MGGSENYEKAFFNNDRYLQENPEDVEKIQVLKDLIAEQIPLLSTGIQIHEAKCSSDVKPLHERLVRMFEQMKHSVEEKYGSRPCEFNVEKLEPATSRRRGQLFSSQHKSSANLEQYEKQLSVELDSDHNRASFNSQSSLEATPLSKAKNISLSMIGISRRKSNASSMNRNDETRGSVNSQHNRTLNTTLESCPDESVMSPQIVITDARLTNSRYNLIGVNNKSVLKILISGLQVGIICS